MRRLLRLLMLCLVALALPLQAVSAMAAPVPSGPSMDASAMADGAMPCPHHRAAAKAGCGACCGPAVAARPGLAVAPAAALSWPAVRRATSAGAAVFLTGGLDRPPRRRLA